MSRIAGVPETVLVAPDKFKGTFRATEVAAAIGRGLEAAGRPVDLCPVADGGDGTLDALAAGLGAERRSAAVTDPLGRPIEAEFGLAGDIALLDMAAASGLSLVAEAERDAVAASTAGTGELIAAAVEAGARTVYLGVGGSATTDGGAGALEALDAAGVAPRLEVLCDVRTPFELAPSVFGPQKGADPRMVKRLERRLAKLAEAAPRDPRGVRMSGAAGGLSGGLYAYRGAKLVAGAPYVLDTVGFDELMRASRFVVTGEGRLDEQTLAGKAAGEVATRCRQAGVWCHAVVGQNGLDSFAIRLLDFASVSEAGTKRALRAAGRKLGLRTKD